MPASSAAPPKAAGGLRAAEPMEAEAAPELPRGPGWWFEAKWDGFRCLAFRNGAEVILQAKSGKPLTRFFPEVAALLARLRAPRFALDGELIVASEREVSFELLQMRLHPAESRIRKLAAATPASLALFDMLQDVDGRDLRPAPLSRRRDALNAFLARFKDPHLIETPGTADRGLAQSWLETGRFEGVVAKRLDGPYLGGERAMVKVKRVRTADCVVGGFRYGRGSRLAGSLLLGLYDHDGRLRHVGFTSGFAGVDLSALTRELESLRGGPSFTGAAPGGPSRWSTERSTAWEQVRPALVVEVSFDHVSGGRFRHGTRLIRFRPDKSPAQCRIDQIAPGWADRTHAGKRDRR